MCFSYNLLSILFLVSELPFLSLDHPASPSAESQTSNIYILYVCTCIWNNFMVIYRWKQKKKDKYVQFNICYKLAKEIVFWQKHFPLISHLNQFWIIIENSIMRYILWQIAENAEWMAVLYVRVFTKISQRLFYHQRYELNRHRVQDMDT